MRTRPTYTTLAFSALMPVFITAGLLSAVSAQAGQGQGSSSKNAHGQSEKIDVCHVNPNGKTKLLSLPVDAALSHMEHHDGADFFPIDGDCDQSNDCILGSSPNEITQNYIAAGFNSLDDFLGVDYQEEGFEILVGTNNASVIVAETCSIEADVSLGFREIETGEVNEFFPLQTINYDFPTLPDFDTTTFMTDEEINVCKVTLGCD